MTISRFLTFGLNSTCNDSDHEGQGDSEHSKDDQVEWVFSPDGRAADDGHVGDEEDDVPSDVHDESLAQSRMFVKPLHGEILDSLGLREDGHKGGGDGQLREDDHVHCKNEKIGW